MTNVSAAKRYDLHEAVVNTDLVQIKKLLQKGADINQLGPRRYGYGSALHLAVREGQLDIARLLIDRGAEVDVLDTKDFTPLHNAAWNGNLEMTELLLDAGADINASTYDGDTPLSLAQNNHQAQVAAFIQAKLKPAVAGDTKVESTAASDSGVRDVSGTYVMSNLAGNYLVSQIMLKPRSKDVHEVTIAQNGDQLTGTFDEGKGEFWGEIKGDTIKLKWVSRTIFSGHPGKLTFKPGSNDLSVSLSDNSGGEVKFNLTKIEPIIDVSGTYVMTNLIGSEWLLQMFGSRPRSKDVQDITIAQNGDQLTGTFGAGRGKLWGEIKSDTIMLDWAVSGGNTGRGEWTFKPGSNESSVRLHSHSAGEVKFNLTKKETEVDSIDVSGTYIAETTWSGNNTSVHGVVRKMNGKLMVLKQTGNTITGSINSQPNWIDGAVEIKGTREGNIINFYIIRGNEIIGSWEINADATKLEGKWFTNGGDGGSGIWNLTKIETEQ